MKITRDDVEITPEENWGLYANSSGDDVER